MVCNSCRKSSWLRHARLPAIGAAAFLAALPGAALGEGAASRAPLQIVVSLNQQTMKVYAGGEEIAQTRISSGKRGYSTPTGIFSILHKKRHHRSNQYSNAPMPWMQRLTWTGIALHESPQVPDDPASHGCVRIPNGFAEELYAMTGLGEHVIITGNEIAPVVIRHALLPERIAQPGPFDHWRLRMQAGGSMRDLPPISSAAMLAPVRHIQFASTGARMPTSSPTSKHCC